MSVSSELKCLHARKSSSYVIKKFSVLDYEIKELKMEVSLLKKEISNLTNKERERNIILFNVQDDDNFNKNLMKNLGDILKNCAVDIPHDSMVKAERRGRNIDKRPI